MPGMKREKKIIVGGLLSDEMSVVFKIITGIGLILCNTFCLKNYKKVLKGGIVTSDRL